MKRKDFLKYIGGSALFFPQIIKASTESYEAQSLLETLTDSDKVLVLVRLEGGNDGLNTVIPLNQYANYVAARSNVAIPENKVLKPTGVTNWGFHPAMEGFMQLYNDKKLKVIHSVGYENQDFSHFRSTDIWVTGADSDEILNTGWLGRYLKYEYPNFPNGFPNSTMPDPLSVQIGNGTPLLLQGPLNGMGVNVPSEAKKSSDFFERLNTLQNTAPSTPAGDQLTYVRLISGQSRLYNQAMKTAFDKAQNAVTYPNGNELADQLRIVARLIAGGLKTRIYVVSIGSFDTHDNQVDTDKTQGEHAMLLSQLSEGIYTFMKDIEQLGLGERVIGMTFSEFGRRIKSNGSQGTDHGAAAPVFLFGQKVRAGELGNLPTIAAKVSAADNIPMQYDFRSIYTSILKDWFCVEAAGVQQIMLKAYNTLPIIDAQHCVMTAAHEANQNAGKKSIQIYPNPFTTIANITFESMGAHTQIQILNTMGQIIATPIQGYYSEGTHNTYWNADGLPAGTYYCRYRNGANIQVLPMLKVQ